LIRAAGGSGGYIALTWQQEQSRWRFKVLAAALCPAHPIDGAVTQGPREPVARSEFDRYFADWSAFANATMPIASVTSSRGNRSVSGYTTKHPQLSAHPVHGGKGSPKAAGHKIAGVTRSGFRAKPGDI
jgi:hypothetical protein